MAVTYTYDIVEDFINEKANLTMLTEEIYASDIGPELKYITVDDTECKIVFVSALTSQEQNTLGGIISIHTGQETNDDDEAILLSNIDFRSVQVENEATTNSTNFIKRASLEVSDLIDDAIYRIGWYYEWKRDSTSSNFRSRIQVDDSLTIMEQDEESKDSKSWHTASGFFVTTFDSEYHHIDFDYTGADGRSTNYVRRVRLELWRVS